MKEKDKYQQGKRKTKLFHEKMDIDSKIVDSDLVQLQELMETTDDKQQIKDVLMNMIQD